MPCHVQAWWLYPVSTASMLVVICHVHVWFACKFTKPEGVGKMHARFPFMSGSHWHVNVVMDMCGLTCVGWLVWIFMFMWEIRARSLRGNCLWPWHFFIDSAMGSADVVSASLDYWPLSNGSISCPLPTTNEISAVAQGEPRFSIDFWHGTWWLSAKYENL